MHERDIAFDHGAAASPALGVFAQELSEVVGVQLSASRRDLAQAQTLLRDAIERLLGCLPPAGAAQQGDAFARALSNMQFQDLVSQLLRRADDRILGVDALLQELARILGGADASAIDAALQRLGAQTLAPERRTSNSIQQVNMTPGDVELF
jgi:hypothetical protein